MRVAIAVFSLLASCGARRGGEPSPTASPSPSPASSLEREIHGAWSAPVEPFRIVGNLYYVGAANIASYLFATPEGHILIDTGTREMAPVVRGNIAKLGFQLRDVKILLSGHAHYDHVQGHAAMQRATGAQVMALGDDAVALEAGVDRSPLGAEGWQPVHVDRVLRDGDTVTLGGTTLRAVWAPGHTPGCTVWTAQVPEPARSYAIAFYACAGPNAKVPLIANVRFPDLVNQTLGSFERLKQLAPDIVLMMHPEEQFAGTLARIKAGVRPHPLDDPAGWRKLLDDGEAEFRRRVEAERAKLSACGGRSTGPCGGAGGWRP